MASAPIFDALYGDWGVSGWRSSIGTYWAVPYTSLVEVWMNFRTPLFFAAWQRFKVPLTLVSTKLSGARYEYGIGMSAPRWKTMSTSRVRPRQKWGSRMSPVTTSIWAMDGTSSSHPQ